MLVLYFKLFVYLCNITETFNEMRDIRIEKGINKDNALLLCEWSNEQGKEFQEQWMGPKISYPLDYDKIKDLGNAFSIFNQGEFIGMIQEVRIGKDNIHIGRFVIDPRKTGLGFGTEALKRFVDFILEDDNIKSISLTVFDFNQKAKRIYPKSVIRISLCRTAKRNPLIFSIWTRMIVVFLVIWPNIGYACLLFSPSRLALIAVRTELSSEISSCWN